VGKRSENPKIDEKISRGKLTLSARQGGPFFWGGEVCRGGKITRMGRDLKLKKGELNIKKENNEFVTFPGKKETIAFSVLWGG